MNRNSTLFTVLGIFGMIFGVIASITIVGLIIGIPLIIGSKKFLDYAKLTDEEVLSLDRQNLTIWLIVFCVLMFPVGLIALIILFNLEGQLSAKVNSTLNSNSESSVMDEKINKIKELYEMKEQGIITEEDFQNAKNKILND